jgi:hypothetical protein
MDATAEGIGTIRSATIADAAALARLCASIELDVLPLGAADIACCVERGHLLVLDLGAGTLGAIAYVALDHAGDAAVHGRVELFAMHPALAGSGVEDRMASAVLAICEASGCVDLDAGGTAPRVARSALRR